MAKSENLLKEKEELGLHKEVFLDKYPKYKQFKNSIFLMPFVKEDYKWIIAEKLDLMTFEQWKHQNKNRKVVDVER